MKKLKRVTFIILITVILLLIFGILLISFNKDEDLSINSDDENVKNVIAVSIVPEEAFVKAVCGDLVTVVTMIPSGSSPANYEPTPMEIVNFSDAKIYFSIGVPTENQNILPNVTDQKVVKLNEIVKEEYDEIKIADSRDPHIWLSPKRVIVMINTIAKEMVKLDPENKLIYEKNAKEYISKLEELDQNITNALEDVENKKFIVYHPAFGYLADDYDMEVYALEQDGKEATSVRLQEMIDFAKEENIKAIFYQAEIDSSQSQSFAEEIGGKTIMLEPLAFDYIENLEKMVNLILEVME